LYELTERQRMQQYEYRLKTPSSGWVEQNAHPVLSTWPDTDSSEGSSWYSREHVGCTTNGPSAASQSARAHCPQRRACAEIGDWPESLCEPPDFCSV